MKINHSTTIVKDESVTLEDISLEKYIVQVESENLDYEREIETEQPVTPQMLSSIARNALTGASIEEHGTLEITITKNE